MKKTWIVITGFIGMIALSCAATKQAGSTHQELYKNLKILPKDITKQQMDSVMHHFTASLNVRCNYCHVRDEEKKQTDFASDDNKHKLRAREMMHMTNDLNKKYFNLTPGAFNFSTPLMVTCFTCHHGSTDPAVNPPHQERPQQRATTDTTKRNG